MEKIGWQSRVEDYLSELDPNGDMMRIGTSANSEDGVTRLDVHFWTDAHSYHIWATPHVLGCEGQSRKWLAGENWHRGNDLGDGPVARRTFERIKKRILQYELVEPVVSRPSAPVPSIRPENAIM